MPSDEAIRSIVEAIAAAPGGLANGARAFADRVKWNMGGFGNAPMPAPYDGGPVYPSPRDANAYVRNNFDGSPGWDRIQPPLPPAPEVAGPYDLMPVRTPEEQAVRDLIFANPQGR